MDRAIEQSITPQFYQVAKSYQLTPYPVGNLVNPGIGGTFQNYDFSLPIYGKSDVKSVEKAKEPLPGSVPEENEKFSQNKNPGIPVANQGGYGLPKPDTDAIFKAMQTPTVKINKIKYVPKVKSVTKSKDIKKAHKFKLV